MKCWSKPIDLKFIHPAGTSRGILYSKPSWIIYLNSGSVTGKGEASIIPGLSPEYTNHRSFENSISEIVTELNNGRWNSQDGIENTLLNELRTYPSILFALETAWLDFKNGGRGVYFDNDFSRGVQKIPINGLIWMGSHENMQQQIRKKINEGFTTIKMKIGAIDLESELSLLRMIRKEYASTDLTIRVDANGAFSTKTIDPILEQLSLLDIHSIEQPIPPGNMTDMAALCRKSPIPIALDEELIDFTNTVSKTNLLETVNPPFIVLKPSLHGGISGTREWIELAEKHSIKWWMTSALESNIGLNAICQFTAEYINPLPQGLGTGALFSNNFPSHLAVERGMIIKGC
jgi:o-succinylbenzoate synthase